MAAPIIEVDHVTKEFQLGQLTSLGQRLRDVANRLLRQPVAERALFKALDDVSFSVQPGEVLGIIGHNGAGKSTLLKALAGISQPTRGKVTVHGRVAPLIEVGAGLVPDMTGRENVFLNAAILGMRRAEVKRKFDEIVAFAEMETFIDTPVKRYSSGMQVRLGFAIATSVDAEVLIVDEVLAVGDLAFQRKCYDRIEGFARAGNRTLLLVSHNLRQIERLCTRALLLRRGGVVADGNAKAVCDRFLTESNAKIVSDRRLSASRYESSGDLNVLGARANGRTSNTVPDSVYSGEDIAIEIDFEAESPLAELSFTIGVHTTDLFFISVSSSETQLTLPMLEAGRHTVRCVISGLSLTAGAYALHFAVESGRVGVPLFRADNLLTFQVLLAPGSRPTHSERFGAVRAKSAWDLRSARGPGTGREMAGTVLQTTGGEG